ncbi:hypothetical protein LAZ67_23001851 [Cordylochernes scorpioides]|uniref:CCHC-type domain-containing protein n=1 Tax=Cordylochernes scorpioides TaxID=51811 RepID=A0ABY6LVR5_9ARAC|nr:hypothetical protein LAZ67_23001851 [Cordylochernes scorpioides]
MTAQRYVDDVLRPVTLPYLQGVPNALYQQDNARPHTARISQQALQDVQMLPWPPYSPDLSPIEHVWDIIGRRLHALPQPRSEDELWQMTLLRIKTSQKHNNSTNLEVNWCGCIPLGVRLLRNSVGSYFASPHSNTPTVNTVETLTHVWMVETRSGKMQDPAQERIQAEESAKPQPGVTIGRDASSDPVVLNPNIDIPKYDGTEDPRPWIESLEEIGFLYHWADYIISRYAAMNMTGSAKTWLNLHKASFTSWENIKIRLIQDFSLDANKEELRMKLNRMQHWNEPAIRFAEDILVLCNKVDPAMEEETKIEHVIGGLKKEYSFALYLNPPKTTDDLLVVCKKMDSFEKKYRERVEKSRNLYNGPRYSRPQQQSRQYRNNFPQPSTPRRPYNPNFVPKPNLQRNTYNKSQEVSKNRTEDGRPICFKCNKPGHVARYCRVKFIRILEEDPADTQEKVEEKCQMNEISEKSGPRLYADALVETEDGEYIIEESSKMFQTNGLRLARSLINVINRETHIWITNPYPRPLKIMKNQTLAFGSSPAKINEQKELKQVLERYGDLFSSRLGRTNLAKHRIDTEDPKPIKHKPYRYSGTRNKSTDLNLNAYNRNLNMLSLLCLSLVHVVQAIIIMDILVFTALMNRIRTSTGRCNYLLNKWNMSPDQNCDCGQIQTMHHILRDCPRRFFQGTLGDIHRCTEEALEWIRHLDIPL